MACINVCSSAIGAKPCSKSAIMETRCTGSSGGNWSKRCARGLATDVRDAEPAQRWRNAGSWAGAWDDRQAVSYGGCCTCRGRRRQFRRKCCKFTARGRR